jgi:hypothetical protein
MRRRRLSGRGAGRLNFTVRRELGSAMSRASALAGAFIAGGAAALLALYVALRMAPGVIMADDMVDAMMVVADAPLSRFPRGSIVYLKSSVGPMLLEKLRPKYPTLKLVSYSARPEDSGCVSDGSSLSKAPCERDDFIKLEVLSSPTRGSMLVAVGTSKTFGQLLLLKVLGKWRVIVDRSYVV